MDFQFTVDQENLRQLAAKVFAGAKEDLWGALARAGLLGTALPVDDGGAGLGFLALCVLYEEAGRAAAPVPLVPALSGALALAAFGNAEQRQRMLTPLAAGERVLTVALHEPGGDARRPATRAHPDGDAWRLDGVKTCVPAVGEASGASRVLAPARLDDGSLGLFLVDPHAHGVRREAQVGTDGAPLDQLTLAGARVEARDLLCLEGAAPLAWLLDRFELGLCAVELGHAARQVAMIAEHVVRRQQFGKPIGTFQAVAQRAADAYVDLEAMRVTTWQAAWRIAEGLPADAEVAVAKFWAADGGQRVAAAAQHLHGGIGFDRGYPLHRYFLGAKQIELAIGGAARALADLGARLAAKETE
jgi:alkylation response protein AidB-like acyl-CoA dehydrogenase